jgi:hypothetical protein
MSERAARQHTKRSTGAPGQGHAAEGHVRELVQTSYDLRSWKHNDPLVIGKSRRTKGAMSGWRNDIERGLTDFLAVTQLAGHPITACELTCELHPAPHRPPSRLPVGMMAVYCFWGDGCWLKVGKAGPNSQARYTSQHYNPASAPSTLAASLVRDARMKSIDGFAHAQPGNWIKTSCCRVNILISAKLRPEMLSLLEAFLHARLMPRYEG